MREMALKHITSAVRCKSVRIKIKAVTQCKHNAPQAIQ